jgi:hypothetical protein
VSTPLVSPSAGLCSDPEGNRAYAGSLAALDAPSTPGSPMTPFFERLLQAALTRIKGGHEDRESTRQLLQVCAARAMGEGLVRWRDLPSDDPQVLYYAELLSVHLLTPTAREAKAILVKRGYGQVEALWSSRFQQKVR